MKNKILIWEICGMLFIIVFGSLLHFAFEWLGYWKPAALFAAVNESVWEHLKLGFWPAVFYSVIEYFFIGKRLNNFFTAKAISLFLIPVLITVIFYSYTAAAGKHFLAADIATFIVSVVIGQLVSFRILTSADLPKTLRNLGLVYITLSIIIFSLFTYYPLNIEIFKDPVTGGYGIP